MITVNDINTILLLGLLAIATAYILYFGAAAGIPLLILIESAALAIMTSLLIKQRSGTIASSITYTLVLIAITVASTAVNGVLAAHIYAGVLLAVNIVLALLNLGSIRR